MTPHHQIHQIHQGKRMQPLLGLLLIVVAAVTTAYAHDPGLSAVELRFEGDELRTHLIFARADVETLLKLDTNNDGQVAADELAAARAPLEALGQAALEISVDGRRLEPGPLQIFTDDSNGLHFQMSFAAAAGAQLQLRSLLPARFAPGHKQFLTLRGTDEQTLGARLLEANNNLYELDLTALAAHARPQTFWGFLLLGIEHILTGFDHLAFLLALLIAGGTLREAAKIITSFTVAHSLTLALATLNVVNLAPSIVEPLIAVSIIYVGVENLLRREAKRRWLLTFGFGLIHGFGFAGILRELGIGAGGEAVVPLLSFNLGVELGQLAIAALVLPLIWKLQQQPRFILRYAPVCSILVALAGSYWLLERTFFK